MNIRQAKPLPAAAAGPWQVAASWLTCVVLCAGITLAPLCLGATGAWTRFAVEAALVIAIVAWSVCCRPSALQLIAPCGALAIAAVQLLPLSSSFATWVAPISGGAWVVANSETGSTGVRISMDPAATMLSASRLFLGLGATLAVAAAARQKPIQQTFFVTMVAVGIVMWTLGVVFPARGALRTTLGFVSLAGPITNWLDPRLAPLQTSGCSWGETIDAGVARYTGDSGTPGDGCGSYISSNQFAGGMCLTLPFVLTAWMALTRRRVPDIVRHAVLLLMLSAAVATTAYLAGSRAGSASLLVAGLVVWMLSVEDRWLRMTSRAVVAAYAVFLILFAAVLYSGRAKCVESLPEPLASPLAAAARDGRGVATRMAFRMFLASPVAGVGLGCFEPVFSRMVPGNNRFHYAHNDYAQYLAETGLLGVAYAAALTVMLLSGSRRTAQGSATEASPPRTAAWAAVAGIATHSGFDWNMHLPANALLACVAAGLAFPVGALMPAAGTGIKTGLATLRGVVAMLAVVVCGFMLRDAVSESVQRQLRDAIIVDRLHRKNATKPSPDAALAEAIASAESMARFDPGNARLALGLGHAKLHAAGRAEDPQDRARIRQAADQWFRAALSRRAFCTGLPE